MLDMDIIDHVATHYFTELLTSNLKFAHSLVLDSGRYDQPGYKKTKNRITELIMVVQ